MSSFQWWRSWHDAPTDHKWPVVAARAGVKVGEVSAVAWALMDYASQHKERGTVIGFDTEVYAIYSGFPEGEVIAIIQAMSDKGIIAEGKFTNWEKRQPKREDNSTERVRDWRDMKRNETQCNADAEEVTFDSPLPLLYSDSVSVSNSDSDSESTAFQENLLSTAFVQASSIIPHSLDKWARALDAIKKTGATPEDVTTAVTELRDRGYNISGPWSIQNAVIMAKGKRERPPSPARSNGKKTLQEDMEALRKWAEEKESQDVNP